MSSLRVMDILSAIADGVIVMDNRQIVLAANDAARRIMNQATLQPIGQHARGLFKACSEDSQQAVEEALAQMASPSHGTLRAEAVSAILHCEERTVEAWFTPMLDENQAPVGTVVVLRDAKVDQELAQAKNEFVSIVSHELRTPMTSIKGYTDLMLKGTVGTLNKEQQRFLKTIKTNVDRMADLVQHLLDSSRIEAGRLRLDIEAIDLAPVAYEVSETVAEEVKRRDLAFVVDVAPTLPKVYADKSRIVQVLLNLLSNAYRYTPAGGKITLTIRQAGDAVRVDVTDSGIGIPRNEQERIFERFYRIDHPLVKQQAGTGLGLSIARSLIKMHGGKLWLRSEVDKGSTFSFTLPLQEASAVQGLYQGVSQQ